MTIHRLGSDDDTDSYSVELGRVLVTIDDLDALLQLLEEQLPPLGEHDEPSCADAAERELNIEFNGGFCTEPDDLRRLSNDEVASIWITSPNVQVLLGPSQAVAVGDEESAEDIYRRWARARQTSDRPRRTSEDELPKYLLALPVLFGAGAILVLAALVIALLNPALAPVLRMADTSDKIGAIVLFIMAGGFTVYGIRMILSERSNYAVVTPLTLDEYRSRKAINKYPRLSYIVAAVALVITTIISISIAVFKSS